MLYVSSTRSTCTHVYQLHLYMCTTDLASSLCDLLFAFSLFLSFLFCKWIAQDNHQTTNDSTKQHDQQHTSPPHLYPSRTMLVPEYPSINNQRQRIVSGATKEQVTEKTTQHIRQRCFNNADNDDGTNNA